jgi:tRNA G18 (ribose-2'-O)-methylase SpoU
MPGEEWFRASFVVPTSASYGGKLPKIMRKLKHEEIPRPDPGEVPSLPKHPIAALLDNVRSIHNVGSIFRTSDAARIERLWLTGITGTPEHPDLHKTALGAQDVVSWTHEDDAPACAARLRREGYTLAALELTDAPTAARDVEPGHFPLCLAVGNEVRGVQDELIEQADLALEIPQYGAKQSLNVSVAYGIAVFDLVRRYRSFSTSTAERA